MFIDKIGAINVISPSRLMDGGPAILATHKMNQNRAIAGNIVSIPLVRNTLRDCVVS